MTESWSNVSLYGRLGVEYNELNNSASPLNGPPIKIAVMESKAVMAASQWAFTTTFDNLIVFWINFKKIPEN